MKMIQQLEERRDFLERCSRCSQCKFVLGAKSYRHASACPSIDFGQWHAHSASGQIIMGYGLLDGAVKPSDEMRRAVSSCTMCGHCDVSCKTNFGETVEPLDSLYALRAKLAQDGQSPAAYRDMMDNLRKQGNSDGHDRGNRAQWAKGLHDVADLSAGGTADVLLHIGSSLAYDQTRWPSLRRVIQALQNAGVQAGHLGAQEGSSGSTAFDLGFVEDAKVWAAQMVQAVQRSGAKTLVTFSAPALAAFRAVYPRFELSFGAVRVLHFSEYVLELINTGRLSLRKPSALSAETVAYHDPCKLGRLSEPWVPRDMQLDRVMNGVYTARDPQALRFGNDGCYEAPRAVLRAIGLNLEELPRSGSSSYCCGGCGGVKEAQPQAAALAATNRLSELDEVSTSVMISGCSGCSKHMQRHSSDSAQVLDLLDVLAQATESV